MKSFIYACVVFTVIAIFGVVSMATSLYAQETRTPVEIEADQAIEWVRDPIKTDQGQYIARGNAVATQGAYKVKADILIADYRENKQGKTDVWRFTARGNVVVTANGYRATADEAVYLIDTEQTTLKNIKNANETVKPIIVISEDAELRAYEEIYFSRQDNIIKAIGRPQIKQGNRVLRANTLEGRLAQNASTTDRSSLAGSGTLRLERVDAVGNVKIVSPDEVITGDKAWYNLDNDKAEITGAVKITRGSNQLNGDRAIIDLKKGTSQLVAKPNTTQTGTDQPSSGRVKGIFFLDNKGDQ